MNIIVLPVAEQEFLDQIDYYELQRPGLGATFRDSTLSVLAWIQKNPILPRLRGGQYRRVNLQQFPFYIAYVIRSDSIWVVTIAHAFRAPAYWINRVSSQ